MLRCAATRRGAAATVALAGGIVDMLLQGLRTAQVVEDTACSPCGDTRRNPCLGGGVDFDCELGVADVSLDGCLPADLASVAGGVGAGGRDRGELPLRNRCDVGAAGVGGTTCRSTSVPCSMTHSWFTSIVYMDYEQ